VFLVLLPVSFFYYKTTLVISKPFGNRPCRQVPSTEKHWWVTEARVAVTELAKVVDEMFTGTKTKIANVQRDEIEKKI